MTADFFQLIGSLFRILKIIQMAKNIGGPQQRSWRKSGYNNVQVGVGRQK